MHAAPAALRLLRAAAAWALSASAATAAVSTLGRTLCLPPYWPAEFVLRCRPTGLGPALLHAPADALLTTLLLAVPALPLGAGVHLLVRGVEWTWGLRAARMSGAAVAAAAWVWLVARLEPGHLDFLVGWYATAAGAVVAGWIAGWRIPSRRPSRG